MSVIDELELQVETIDIEPSITTAMSGTDHNSTAFDTGQFTDNISLSDEDKEEILNDIEKVVSDNRITVSEDLFAITPVKNGTVFPVITWFLAVAAIGAVFYVSSLLFENSKADLNLESNSYISAEGKLLEELKKEAAQALASKEQEISSIQDELARLDLESKNLQANIETTISEREAELRKQLEAELAQERSKLLAQGKSSVDIERELSALEAQKTEQISAELEAFKTQAAESLKEKEAELARAKQLTEDILRQANAEKERIVEETDAKEAALAAQFEEERQALLAQSTEASQKLQEIAKQQETENLITDQMLAAYGQVIDHMEKEDYPAALSAVERVRSILNDPRVDTLPRILKRKPVETFILDTLKQEIAIKTSSENDTPSGLVDAAEKLFRARGLITRAEAAVADGNSQEAEKLYNQAVETVPELKSAVSGLRSIETTRRTAISGNMMAQARTLMDSGNTREALNSYRNAAAALGAGEKEQEGIRSAFQAYSGGWTTLSNTQTTETEAALRKELNEKSEAEKQALSAEYEEKLSQTQQNLTAEFRQKEAEYTAKIQEMETSLANINTEDSAKLNDALSRITELETSLEQANTEIETLTALLAEKTENQTQTVTEGTEASGETPAPDTLAENGGTEGGSGTIQMDPEIVSAYEERIAALELEIEALNAQMQSGETDAQSLQQVNARLTEELQSQKEQYSADLAALETERATLEQEVGLLQQEKEGIQKDLDAAVLELVNFVTSRSGDERYTGLALLYNEYQARLEELIATDNYAEAKTLLTRFYKEDKVAAAFPGFGSITDSVEAYVAAREKETGIKQGRQSALSDIEKAAGYLEKDVDTDFSRTPLDVAMASEPRFSDAVKRIQSLAANTLQRRVSSSKSASSVFIGSISRINGDTFTVESLVTGEIPVGTKLVIKRISSSGDTVIAKGTAVSQRGSRIEATITEKTETSPRTVDLVYTE